MSFYVPSNPPFDILVGVTSNNATKKTREKNVLFCFNLTKHSHAKRARYNRREILTREFWTLFFFGFLPLEQ
jgi:hypothetical protein